MEPALESCGVDQRGTPVSQEAFLGALAKVLKRMAELMKEQPVIVAHSENTFDGSGIRRLLANNFEADKVSSLLTTTHSFLQSLFIGPLTGPCQLGYIDMGLESWSVGKIESS